MDKNGSHCYHHERPVQITTSCQYLRYQEILTFVNKLSPLTAPCWVTETTQSILTAEFVASKTVHPLRLCVSFAAAVSCSPPCFQHLYLLIL